MIPYNEIHLTAAERCPKCGQYSVRPWNAVYIEDDGVVVEHLELSCPTCGYYYAMATADSPLAEAV